MPKIVAAFVVALVWAAGALSMDKVILDTDMVEGFDDGVAMLMLAADPEVELLGVTTVAGNSWVAEGTAYALRQLELVGRDDIPVLMGTTRPLRPGRYEGLDDERKRFGIAKDQWVGAFDRPDPEDWRAVYRDRYGREPELEPRAEHAVPFIIDTVRRHPGEITVVAIGPLTNIALAVRMAPDIVPLIKRIVYMGGSFFQPGNVTPTAEFNWWIDPEAAKIVVRSPFREQVVFGLDVCEKVVFDRRRYDALIEAMGEGEAADLLESTFVGLMFAANPDFSHFIWDVLTVMALRDPSLITGKETCPIDVVDEYGQAYGQSLAYTVAPEGAQTATIVTDVDVERVWKQVIENHWWARRK